jgi:DNA-binding NarL/FixJ family response regulator
LQSVSIMLVDDQNLVNMGIKELLELNPAFKVVAQLTDGTEVVESLKLYKPSLLLLDIRMPRMDGIQVLESINAASIQVPTLILTTFDEHDLLLKCMKLGAKGYLRKDISLDTLVAAIEAVAGGDFWVQPAVTQQVTLHKINSVKYAAELFEPLTKVEVQILRLVAAGYSNIEIAEALHKSHGRVRNIVTSVLSKLHTRDRTRAALKAVELGLI